MNGRSNPQLTNNSGVSPLSTRHKCRACDRLRRKTPVNGRTSVIPSANSNPNDSSPENSLGSKAFIRVAAAGRSRRPRIDGDPAGLCGVVPAGRRNPAVRADSDEPVGPRSDSRLPHDGSVVKEGCCRGPGGAQGERRGGRRGAQLYRRAGAQLVEAHPRRGVCALLSERNHRRSRVPSGARCRGRAAGRRHVLDDFVAASGRPEIRFDLRWRPEKHWPGGPCSDGVAARFAGSRAGYRAQHTALFEHRPKKAPC